MTSSRKKTFQMPKTKQEFLRIALAVVILGIAGYFFPNDSKQESPSLSTSHSQTHMQEKILVQFVRVVDGDTIVVKWQHQERRVRYLMVDTPESVKEGLKPQPFGKEASKRNEELLKNAKQVTMMFDKGATEDDYGRLLAYVYADDVLIAEQLLKEGLASVSYVNPPNNSLEKEFRAAQKIAQKAKLNIWSIEGYVNQKGKFKIQD